MNEVQILLEKSQERQNYYLSDFSRNSEELHLVTREDQEFIQMGCEIEQKLNGVEEKHKSNEDELNKKGRMIIKELALEEEKIVGTNM